MMNKKLALRIGSAIVMIILCFWAIFATAIPVFLAICFAISLIGIIEYHLIIKGHVPSHFLILIGTHLLQFTGAWLLYQKKYMLAALVVIFGIALITGLGTRIRNTFKWHVIPVIWISFPFCLLFWIRVEYGAYMAPQLILLLLLMVSINDIAAYFGGKTFGKSLLAPKISPKKTKEGSLFGILGGLAGAIISIYFIDKAYSFFQFDPHNLTLKSEIFGWKLILLVVLVVPFAQVGDLLESKLKRQFNVKDSSNFIPGHGGFLDRYDAYLLAIPVFYILLKLFGFSVSIPS